MDAERSPRVLMTADTVGGVWTYAVELARALAARGARVDIATMGAPLRAHQRAQLAEVAGVALHEGTWKLEWMESPWDDVDRAGAWLLALEHRLRPDVVHLNQFAFGALPFQAPALVVAHSCVLTWWRAVHGCEAPPEWDIYRQRVGAGLAAAAEVVAPTRAMLKALAAEHGLPRGRGSVIANGRDPQLLAPAAAREPFVFAAGRFWDEAKNLAALDAAAAGLPWPVRVAGSCRHPDGGLRIPSHAEALGELPAGDVLQLMGQASIYALPALYEPFGLSVLEAALGGCALVLGDIPSLRETWGDAALFVPPRDSAALADALRSLIDQPGRRQALAAAARARARRYHPDRMATSYLQAYAALRPATLAREETLTCVS